MGRLLEGGSVSTGGGGDVGVPGEVRPSADNPVTGIFGLGRTEWFRKDGTFVVPADITAVRVRLWGGGGLAGGGFAIKTITGLTPGGSITVTVGAGGGFNDAGGTTSFGSYFSATGGDGDPDRDGGTGVGGDFNSIGGDGNASSGGGGGAAGIFGDGGGANQNSENGNSGGGGNSSSQAGNGISGKGGKDGTSSGEWNPNGDPGIVTSLDFIATGGGGAGDGNGANGGAGGQSGGAGGFPGAGSTGFAADGLVIVEW
jgi:hypothetical protein